MHEPFVGLEDVVITTSSICFIDGDKGILRYRGYDVAELAEKSTYEEVAYLILYGQLPSAQQFSVFQADLRKNRGLPAEFLDILKRIPPQTDAMAWLRTAVSALASFDSESDDNPDPANLRKTPRLTPQFAAIARATEHIRPRTPHS